MQKKITIKINNDYQQRIDNFIFKKYKTLPKRLIYKSIRKGNIKVNQKKIQASYKIKLNDIISFFSIKITDIKKKKLFLTNHYLIKY